MARANLTWVMINVLQCVPKIATLAFLNSGQICMLPKRIYMHEKIYDEFRAAMVDFTKANIKTGGGFEPDIVVGPVQNQMQYVSASPFLSTGVDASI